MFFKRIPILTRIDDQIYAAEKALIENQTTADGYQAAANGNKATLERLRALREDKAPLPALTIKVPVPKVAAKLRAA